MSSSTAGNYPPAPDAETWQPGDPLHAPALYRGYGVFNFRYDCTDEYCGCGDAASWPVPATSDDLGDTDELAAFIAHVQDGRALRHRMDARRRRP